MSGVLKSFFKTVGKGALNYAEKSAKDIVELGEGTLNVAAKAGEKIIDSATKEGGKLNNMGKKYFEEVPEDEKGIIEELIPYRMKRYKTDLKKGANGRTVIKGEELTPVNNALFNSATWVKDTVIKSPGGRIALGITGGAFAVGLAEGGMANTLGPVEGERTANMITDELSPLLKDDHAIDNAEIHGINTYGADANLVFALHNMR